MPLLASDVEQAAISREQSLKNHLPHLLHINSPNEGTEKAVLNVINRLATTAKHRRHGLELLHQVITSLSPATVREHGFTWIEQCMIRYLDDVLRELKLRVLAEIVKLSHKESDFNRRFVTNYLSKVFDTCLTTVRVNPYECKTALSTLTVLMQIYPSWFGAYKEKIEAFIVIFLDNSDKDLVLVAAKAFHYLQQVGGAGTNGDNHKASFTRGLHKLCNTFHSVYAKLVENHYFERNPDELFDFQVQDDFELNSQRIENILVFVHTMIRTGFPVAKQVKPSILLGMLATALSFHKCLSNEDEHSVDDCRLSFVLLRLQSAALKCLKLTLVWLGTNSLPFSYQISRMIVESVERSGSCLCYQFDSLFAESAFAALTEWLTISKSSLHPQFQARLLEVFCKRIAPAKPEITLKISESLTGKSKKAKRREMTERIVAGARETTTTEQVTAGPNEMTAVKCLLRVTNLSVKPSLLKRLYWVVFDTLHDLQRGRRFVAHPQGLYEVLIAFFGQNVPILPPLHTALTILNRGATGNDRFIARACAEGLRVLEGMCQPVCPSLYLCREGEEEEPIEMDTNQDGQESYQDVEEYQVKYTESDRSTIEDGLSEKSVLQYDLTVEEITEETVEAPIHNPPIVTAPSEDGNEILEVSVELRLEEDETPPASEDANEIREEKVTEEKREVVIELDDSEDIPEEKETNRSIPKEKESSKKDDLVAEDIPEKKETNRSIPEEEESSKKVGLVGEEISEKTEEKPTNGEIPGEEELLKEDTTGKELAANEEADCLEPAAKKLKLSEEEVEAKDPDDSYLEDDSFVDVVKDYY